MVHAEIGMHVQETAARGLMKAPALKTWIGHESGNSGEPGQPGGKSIRVEIVGYGSKTGREKLALSHAELVFVVMLVLRPRFGSIGGKFLGNCRGRLGVEKVFQANVREGLVLPV